MALGGDVSQAGCGAKCEAGCAAAREAAREAARFGISTAIQMVLSGAIEIGAATAFVAPLCTALLEVKRVIDEAKRNQEELDALFKLCDLITVHVIAEATGISSGVGVNVSLLQDCVDEFKKLAKRCERDPNKKKWSLTRLFQSRGEGDDIQKLRTRIEDTVSIMGLSGVQNVEKCVANLETSVENIRQMLLPRTELPVAKGAPVTATSHVWRDGVVDAVYNILQRDNGEGPAVAALVGRSGAGKTTAAAAMVRKQVLLRPRTGETDDQARMRQDRVRALFPDGVVWLRVGKGEGAENRLPALMRTLAKCFYEDVMKERVVALAKGERGETYVEALVSQRSLRCLVVADDVWERSVVEKLRKTGMSVLVTTRSIDLVGPNASVVVDKLTQSEAENVLRLVAEIPDGESLCPAAIEVLKICHRGAMDIAFVGSWSSVRTGFGKPKTIDAWARTVEELKAEIDSVRARYRGMEDVDVKRLAVLRTGSECLGEEDKLARKLYMMLAVFPDGHSFDKSDAAVLMKDPEVLMKDPEVTEGALSILERWAVLKIDDSCRYRMHDAHLDFARQELMGSVKTREQAVKNWTAHVSRLDFVVDIDVYALLNIWRALERVGGKGWWASRPYDDELVQRDAADPSKIRAVHVVAELYEHDAKFGDLEGIMKRVLEHDDEHEGDSTEVHMAALYYTRNALDWQQKYQEGADVTRQLSLLVKRAPHRAPSVHESSIFHHMCGVCEQADGRLDDAEKSFQQALEAQEGGGFTTSSPRVRILHDLGRCLRMSGRAGKAQELFQQALQIEEAELGPSDLKVAVSLTEMGMCEEPWWSGGAERLQRPGTAEELYKRALEIVESKLGPKDLRVAMVLDPYGVYLRLHGRLGEAAQLLQRALVIKETNSRTDCAEIAWTAHEIGLCVREVGRPEDAESFFTRAHNIEKNEYGAGSPRATETLTAMAECVRRAGRPEEASRLFAPALKIATGTSAPTARQIASLLLMGLCMREAGRPGNAQKLWSRALVIAKNKLEADNLWVNRVTFELGLLARDAGRPGEAEELLSQALKIKEQPEKDDLRRASMVFSMLFGMGRRARAAGRPVEAEALFKRALVIQQAKPLGPDEWWVMRTHLQLGLCARKAGQPGKAEELFGQAVKGMEDKLGSGDIKDAWMLHEMGVCVRDAGRPGEAKELFERALAIWQAKLGPDDLRVTVARQEVQVCVQQAWKFIRLAETLTLLEHPPRSDGLLSSRFSLPYCLLVLAWCVVLLAVSWSSFVFSVSQLGVPLEGQEDAGNMGGARIPLSLTCERSNRWG